MLAVLASTIGIGLLVLAVAALCMTSGGPNTCRRIRRPR